MQSIPIPSEPVITEIRLKGVNQKENRQVEVVLSNGSTVLIESLYEGFQQTRCTVEEAKITVDIAWKYNAWLHGKGLPR